MKSEESWHKAPVENYRKNTPNLAENDLALGEVAARYAVAITPEVAAVAAIDPSGAVARQFYPDVKELITTPDELADPIGDDAYSPVKGIVHRYPDRALLKPVHVCAVYCRYCFRREMVGPGKAESLTAEEIENAFSYIQSAPRVWEVIITGGDPFVLSPRRLQAIMDKLNTIDHVKVIRFHSRVPVSAPNRITPELIKALHSDKAVYVVYHVNHAAELTPKVRAVTQMFLRAGIPLLSQSVLLRGVNDSAATLEKLFRTLVEMRIKPYYLHHPDKAAGTSHFRLSLREGRAIVKKLWGSLSGLAQPSYVLDIPGGHGKVRVEDITEQGDGYEVKDFKGRAHSYKDS